jgi:hypothetical protein
MRWFKAAGIACKDLDKQSGAEESSQLDACMAGLGAAQQRAGAGWKGWQRHPRRAVAHTPAINNSGGAVTQGPELGLGGPAWMPLQPALERVGRLDITWLLQTPGAVTRWGHTAVHPTSSGTTSKHRSGRGAKQHCGPHGGCIIRRCLHALMVKGYHLCFPFVRRFVGTDVRLN